jgi:hypothetical protein
MRKYLHQVFHLAESMRRRSQYMIYLFSSSFALPITQFLPFHSLDLLTCLHILYSKALINLFLYNQNIHFCFIVQTLTMTWLFSNKWVYINSLFKHIFSHSNNFDRKDQGTFFTLSVFRVKLLAMDYLHFT